MGIAITKRMVIIEVEGGGTEAYKSNHSQRARKSRQLLQLLTGPTRMLRLYSGGKVAICLGNAKRS
jgi:hypothetical protein